MADSSNRARHVPVRVTGRGGEGQQHKAYFDVNAPEAGNWPELYLEVSARLGAHAGHVKDLFDGKMLALDLEAHIDNARLHAHTPVVLVHRHQVRRGRKRRPVCSAEFDAKLIAAVLGAAAKFNLFYACAPPEHSLTLPRYVLLRVKGRGTLVTAWGVLHVHHEFWKFCLEFVGGSAYLYSL